MAVARNWRTPARPGSVTARNRFWRFYGPASEIQAGFPSRLLKKIHLRRWRARAALQRTDQVRLAPAPILRMGTRRAALHLDLFEQPGRKRVLQYPARRGRPRVFPTGGEVMQAENAPKRPYEV